MAADAKVGKPPRFDIFQLSSDHYDLGSFASLGLRASLPAFVEWSLESLTSQCYGLCAPNPSTKARVRRSGAPSYDCFCPLRKPLLGSWPDQALIGGRNTTFAVIFRGHMTYLSQSFIPAPLSRSIIAEIKSKLNLQSLSEVI